MPTIYYETPHFTILWDETCEAVLAVSKGYREGEEMRRGLDKCLELLKVRNAHKWLSDSRDQRVVAEVDQRWVRDDWFPRAIEAGLRSAALLVPANMLASLSMNRVLREIGPIVETRYFDDLEKGREWLRSR